MLQLQKYAGTLIITLNVLVGLALFAVVPSLWKSYDGVMNRASAVITNSGAVSEHHLTVYCVSNAWIPPHDMNPSATPLEVIQEFPRHTFRTMHVVCRCAGVLLLLNSILVLWHRWEK
jgi:ABC-type uncharacterized transport system YnjBCD permease subunit